MPPQHTSACTPLDTLRHALGCTEPFDMTLPAVSKHLKVLEAHLGWDESFERLDVLLERPGA